MTTSTMSAASIAENRRHSHMRLMRLTEREERAFSRSFLLMVYGSLMA